MPLQYTGICSEDDVIQNIMIYRVKAEPKNSMAVTVVWIDSSGNHHEENCEWTEEGDHGITLRKRGGNKQVGYVPYEQLEYVVPAEDSDE